MENGFLHAASEGTTVITAKYGKYSTTRTVTVSQGSTLPATGEKSLEAKLDKNWSIELPKLNAEKKDRYLDPIQAADGNVYIASLHGQLVAIDASGKLLWQKNTGRDVDMLPVEGPDGKVYAGFSSGIVSQYDQITGQEATITQGSGNYVSMLGWDETGARYIGYMSPRVTRSGNQTLMTSSLYASEPNGSHRWFTGIGGQIKHQEPAYSADGRTLYLVAANNESLSSSSSQIGGLQRSAGKLYAIDSASGTVRWNKELKISNFTYFKPLVREDGNIAVVSSDGTVQVFDTTGRELWSYELKSSVSSPPFMQNDRIMVNLYNSQEGIQVVNDDISTVHVHAELRDVNRTQDEVLYILADSVRDSGDKLVTSYRAAGYDQTGKQRWVVDIPGKGTRVSGISPSRHLSVLDSDAGSLTMYTVKVTEKEKPTAPAAAFGDMVGHWASDAVQRLTGSGVVSGYPDGSFRPQESVTREQFLAMLAAKLKAKAGDEVSPQFEDVPDSRWSSGAIEAALSLGWIASADYGESFRPGQAVTRAEVAIWVAKALKLSPDASGIEEIKDKSSIPWKNRGYIGAIVKAGIVTGYPDGTFRPGQTLTRAEAAVLLDRLET